MDILLVSLNAKFIHSSLALRMLKSYADTFNYDSKIIIKEYTINNNTLDIVTDIYKSNIKFVGFSAYIWNVDMVLDICSILKKLDNSIKIFVGGPEAADLIQNESVDITVLGEGEYAFKNLILYFNNKISLDQINNICYNNKIICNQNSELVDLNLIPFVYNKENLIDLEHKIIYYETTRGCPFNCYYCTSSLTDGVRFLDIKRVLCELNFFISNKVVQVKFIDRTFNANKKHCNAIWEFLINNDNNFTNFHFEISADLLDEQQLDILKKARKGLFQFEVGIQSTNEITLKAINRKTNLQKIYYNIKQILLFDNINIHLDLIAGLPYETYNSFKKSFNDVYKLKPNVLQLGFLKILKETKIKKDYMHYGIVYSNKAPYEILFSNDISFIELAKLKQVENVLEIFFNSGKFKNTLNYVIDFFNSPFDFYEMLADFFEHKNLNAINHNKIALYVIFFEFIKLHQVDIFLAKDLLKFDMLLHDNLKNLPEIFSNKLNIAEKERFKKLYSNQRQTNLEKFNYDIINFINYSKIIKKDSYILFNYHNNNFYDVSDTI